MLHATRLRGPVALLLLLALALPASMPSPAGAQGDSHLFPETGFTVSGLFLRYWQEHGGLAQQGYPISPEFVEVSDLNGQPYKVQYFERAVFEHHPENQPPHDVLLSQLGKFRYDEKYPSGAPGQQENQQDGRFFPETGHWIGGRFWQYWQANGGLAQQGYPISGEFVEVSDLNHLPYKVQYFERAVFELHPENQPPFDVLLSQLGKFRYRQKYGQGAQPTITPVTATPTRTPPIPMPTATPTAVPPPAPAQVSPAEGAVLRVFPRVATFTWDPVSYPGGVTYNVEIEWNGSSSWQPFREQTGLAGTSYTMPPFPGDNPGRWRVWATGSNGVQGAKSGWRTFSFNTGAAQYAGTWLNEDLGTGGVAKLWITRSGQTLNVHWFGSCGGALCDNGTRSAAFNGEPFVIDFAGPPGHQFTITLDNPAGARLKLVDVSSGGGSNTYYFTRATAAMYAGTWVNVDPNTGGPVRFEIANSGDTLNVHWYGACGLNPCDNGTRSAAFGGEPFVINFPGPPSHEFTITFDNAARSRLRVVDVGSSSGTNTYLFRRP